MRGRPGRTALAALALLALLASAACGPHATGGAPGPEPYVVEFSNQASDQAAVYARHAGGGAAVRIGSVPPGRTETLRVPAGVSRDGTVIILSRLLARRGYASSGEIQLRPGERMAVTLPPAGNVLTVLPIPEHEP